MGDPKVGGFTMSASRLTYLVLAGLWLCIHSSAFELVHPEVPLSYPPIFRDGDSTTRPFRLPVHTSSSPCRVLAFAGDVAQLVCSVSDFGATGKGEVYDTLAIQSSIEACANQGGGIVLFSPGLYLTGTIFLRSKVTLHISEGARLLGGPNLTDYPRDLSQWYLILAESAVEVGITGGGMVDGQGLKFVTEFKDEKNIMVSWNETGNCLGDECRPRMVGFINCKDVHIWNIQFREPAYWCLHIVSSDGVLIEDVEIYGDFNCPNNDGIDIEGSNNTMIRQVRIDTGDDAICPKSNAGPLHNLTVSDCWIRTKSSAVKLGSGSAHDFVNLHFERLTIVDSHRGLAIQLRDSGSVLNVTFSDVQMSTRYYDPSWWGRAEPIYVTACPRDAYTKVGSVRGVRFVDITAVSENGIFLAGCTESKLQGLEFVRVYVRLQRFSGFVGGLHDYRPGCQGLVDYNGTSGIFMEHVEDATFKKVSLGWSPSETPRWGSPLQFNPSTVYNLRMHGFRSEFWKSAPSRLR